jgi:acetyltransferase-like isoleucine patch superfamily enzyme
MKISKKQSGFVMALLLSVIVITSTLIVTTTSKTISNMQSARAENARRNAQFAADAGLDVGIHELNLDENYTGTGSQVTLLNTTNTRTTYEVLVSPGAVAEKRVIRSTGRTYEPATATIPKTTRIFEIEVEAVTSGTGPGAVVSGVGGLILNNNSRITGGDVIVNGTVTVGNGAQIGLSTNSVNLRVAHQSCPVPVTSAYPQVCTSGQPITNNGLIYADVKAQNQTNGTGMSLPGLTSSTFAPIAVPGYDREAHKAALQFPTTNPNAAGYAPNNAAVSCGNNQSKTWNANIKISGNVSLGNGCTVTILGNVWITGNLTFGNNSTIVIGTTGATRPVIMIDGSAGLNTGNNSRFTPNASGTGAEVVTMWWNTNTATNGNFNCGGISDLLSCSAVTGLALSTSQTTTTINLSNNTNASNTIFRTLWSRAVVSNNGALGAVAGQTIQLGNNAVINFTASIAGSDNLTTTWVKRGYLRVYQ